MQKVKQKKVNSCSPESLETLNWQDVEKLNPQPLHMWKIKLNPTMLQEGGYQHEFYDRPRARHIRMVCDEYYTYERIRRDILIPLGFVASESKSNEQAYNEYMQFMREVFDYAESKRWGQTFPSVGERDINRLLVEEFYSSAPFCKWFLDKIGGCKFDLKSFENAKAEVFDRTGESDIELYFLNSNDKAWCLLIENKISAKFQPSQAERYKQRGQLYIEDNKCIGFSTILIAPANYLNHCNEKEKFDFPLTYQDLHSWFIEFSNSNCEIEACRAKYKARQIQLAIKK